MCTEPSLVRFPPEERRALVREIARLARLFEMGVGFKGGYSDFAEKILSKIESRGSERTSPSNLIP